MLYTARNSEAASPTVKSPEQMETVLSQGMAFIGSLLEMAAGKKLEATDTSGKMVSLNRETGEVPPHIQIAGF